MTEPVHVLCVDGELLALVPAPEPLSLECLTEAEREGLGSVVVLP